MPVVCIYIEGGVGVLHHACVSVSHGLPIVVVENSSRAAGLLAFAYKSDGLKQFVFADVFTLQILLELHTITISLKCHR